jgi:tight adherence protein B
MTLVAALAGLCAAAGALLLVDGLQRRTRASRQRTGPVLPGDRRRRATAAAALGAVALVLTRWPVAAVALAGLGWFWTDLFQGGAARQRAVARTEAIATWAEMLRDTMSGAHGLEEAVITSADVAPAAIRPELTSLAVRVEREPLDAALRAFAGDLAHPSGDLVVSALTLAARGGVGDLNDLLGALALSAREEAAMRMRVDAARARLRTAVRVIAAVTAVTAFGLIVLNRSYLDVYGTTPGQLVLAAVAAMWAAALWWLSRMSRFVEPQRFLAPFTEETP